MERRLKEARFPKVKTLEEFNFEVAPHLPATGLRKLAEGQYIEKKEPLVFIGDACLLDYARSPGDSRYIRSAMKIGIVGTRLPAS